MVRLDSVRSRFAVRLTARPYAVLVCATLLLVGAPAAGQSRTDMAQMSLDSLLAIPVHAAARYAQTMTEAPASVTVITGEEIAAFGYRTLGQVLARAAGFYVSDDRNYTYIGVRGFSRPTDYNNRVLLLLNGHVVNEGVYGAAPIGTELGLDLSLIERVEIVRGPVSALYGTSAMFAVVNLVTIQPDAAGGGITTEAGQAGHLSISGRAHAAPGPDRAYFVTAQYGREDGVDHYYPEYATDGSDGIVRDLDWTRYASGFAAARLGALRLHARAATREKGVPTGGWSTTFGDPDHRTIDRWTQLAGTYDRSLAPSVQLSVGGSGDIYWYRGWYPDSDGLYQDATDEYRLSASAQTVWDVSPRNRVVTGVTATFAPHADYIGWYDDEEPDFAVDEPYTTVGLYLQDELHVQRWLSIIGGGRLDTRTTARPRITPRGSVILRPLDGTTVKLLYGAAFRSPNVYERAFGNATEGRSSDLQPEQIVTREIVAEQRLGRAASVRVSVFDDEMRDLIDAVEDPHGDILYFNVGHARTRGLEGEFTVAAGGWLVQGGGVLQSARDRATGDRLSNAPRAIVRIGANGNLYRSLSGAAQLRTESARLTLAGSETSAFTVADATLSYRHGSLLRGSLYATNLFDRSYSYPAGVEHRQDAIAQDGRRLTIRLEITR